MLLLLLLLLVPFLHLSVFVHAKSSLKRFGNLNGGRFALVGVFIDVQPFVVDGVFHAAERFE